MAKERKAMFSYIGDGHSKSYPYEVEVTLKENGSLVFSDPHGEDFIYLYPAMVKRLKLLLKGRKPQG